MERHSEQLDFARSGGPNPARTNSTWPASSNGAKKEIINPQSTKVCLDVTQAGPMLTQAASANMSAGCKYHQYQMSDASTRKSFHDGKHNGHEEPMSWRREIGTISTRMMTRPPGKDKRLARLTNNSLKICLTGRLGTCW